MSRSVGTLAFEILRRVVQEAVTVSEDDIALMDAGLDMRLDFFALSFVRRREDLDPVREHLRERGVPDVPLIAKVEKPQAAANGEEIIDAADGVMIARGDLGIELPIEEVPLVQKRLLAVAGRRAKPTITARWPSLDETALPVTSPFFLTLVDSLGVRQVLRFARVAYEGAQPAAGAPRHLYVPPSAPVSVIPSAPVRVIPSAPVKVMPLDC